MNRPDDTRRDRIAWIVTIVIHIVVLLIPVTMKVASEATASGPEIKGYISGLVDLSGSPDGVPGVGTPGSGHEGGSSTAITVPKPKAETVKPSVKPELKKPAENPSPKTPETNPQPAKEPSKPVDEPKREPVKATGDSGTVKDGKPGSEPSAGDKNGAGSGSGTGTGSGTGSGNGSGQGSGNGSGTGDGKEQGPGSGPKRHGLGTGQGNVIIDIAPTYPKDAQNDGVTGKVVVRIVVGTDGNVAINLQSSGDKRLDNAVIRAVKKAKFKPEEAPYHLDIAVTFDSKGVHKEYLGSGWEDEKA